MEDTSTQEAPIRVMALHALAYCERLFYLEEVEGIRIADADVYAGRALHQQLQQAEEEKGEWSSFELSSEKLGLVGKVDALKRRNGTWIPYEHKRGRARRENKKAIAWPSDALQVTAYTMLLEEELSLQEPIQEARVRYHRDNVTVRVSTDKQARDQVLQAIQRSRVLRDSLERPPITEHDAKCLKCSLAPVCLPEEERVLEDKSWEPVRLFPPDLEKKNIHIQQHGARISRSGNALKVIQEEETTSYPVHEVGTLILHGYPQITTQALHACLYHGISVHWLTCGGRYLAGIQRGVGNVQRKVRQYQALHDPTFCGDLVQRLVHAKVENTLRYILRATRGTDRTSNGLADTIQSLRNTLKAIPRTQSPDKLRGHEGLAAKTYFQALPSLLREEVPEAMKPRGRNRRPPKDRFNALLSFGYALLYQAVLQAVMRVGLEPAIGFFHTPRSSAYPLVLDLMELFRLSLWDLPLIASVNRLQWDIEVDFEEAADRIWLSKAGRKKAIQLFERRLQDSWRHPVVKYSLSYARLLELEIRLLEKEWTQSPGLFAQMRLR